ncbi:MAG TPA: hypothetical protein VNX65_01445 [Patescibacteria group bacterium]|jgi:hypothetical protein|nr:hypothetical protein [Patescibacteria group bacterium]
MNDLDFDELDTAVNSLVSKNQPKSEPVVAQEAKDKEETPSPPKLLEEHTEEAHKLVEPVVVETNPSPTVRVVAKRPVNLMPKASAAPAMTRASHRGFIDIMAPKTAPKVPARTGLTVMPPRIREEATRQPVPVVPSEMPAQPPSPDPILDTEKSTETPVAAPANSTPFVNIDKVEKRPLGAYSSVAPQAPEPEELTVPPELSPDMLAVESGESMPSAPEAAPVAPNKPAEHNHPARSKPKAIQTNEMAKAVDDFRPVYDVKDNPPLVMAKVENKKMKLWLKVLISLIILALLGVGGYFAYTLLMPTTST